MTKFIECQREGGAYLITPNDVYYPDPKDGEVRGEITSRGPWQIISTYKALAISGRTWENEPLKVFGMRTLSGCRESGYDLEGKVSIGGKSYRGFTSSVLFQMPDGKLVNVAAIHVCM